MTIRKLLALLAPYAEGARDGEECEITVDEDTGELRIDCGSDIHDYCINHDVCVENGQFGCRYAHGEKCEGCTNIAAKHDSEGVPLCDECYADMISHDSGRLVKP